MFICLLGFGMTKLIDSSLEESYNNGVEQGVKDTQKEFDVHYDWGHFDGYEQAFEDMKLLEWCDEQLNPPIERCFQVFLERDYRNW